MLAQLWKKRECSPLFSRAWARSWAKRVWTFPSLTRFSWRAWWLRRRGAKIGTNALFSPIRSGGNHSWLSVGDHSFIGRIEIQLHAEVRIGSYVSINDGVRLITASHDVRDPRWRQFAKPIIIEDFAWVATGAMILPGVTIGRGAVVGAGAVVGKSLPAGAVAIGNPAEIRERVRSEGMDYSPVRFVGFMMAWLGNPAVSKDPR